MHVLTTLGTTSECVQAAAVVFSKHSFEPLLFSILVSLFEYIFFVSLTQLTPEGLDEMIHPQIYVTVIAYTGFLGQPHKVDDHLLNLALSCSNFPLTNTCKVVLSFSHVNHHILSSLKSVLTILFPCLPPPLSPFSQ